MQRSRRLRVQCGCAFVAEVDIDRSVHFGALVLPLCAVLLCCCGLVRCCYGLRCTMLMCGTRYSLLLVVAALLLLRTWLPPAAQQILKY